MSLHATLEVLEQHIEQLTQSLQQAHDALDEAETEPLVDEVQEIDGMSDRLQSLTSQLETTCGEWRAETEQLNARLGDAMVSFKATLAEVQSRAESEAASLSHGFAETRSRLDTSTGAFLEEAERAVASAERTLDAMLGDTQENLSGLLDSVQARFVDATAHDVGEAISALTGALAQVESAGGDVARTALTGIKTITDGLEGIMDVLNAVKPAFDAISVVA